MKKQVYEYEHTQGPIYVSGKTEHGEHYLFLANKNSPMVLAEMNRVHTQTPGNARRLAASWNACQSFTTEELEYGMPEKLSETERVWETTLMQAVEEDGPKSVVEAINKIKAERDELLAMLEEMVDGGDNVCGFDNPCTCRVCRGRALIAKIKEAYHVG